MYNVFDSPLSSEFVQTINMYNQYRGYQPRFQYNDGGYQNNRNYYAGPYMQIPRRPVQNFVPVQQWNANLSRNFPERNQYHQSYGTPNTNKRAYSGVNPGGQLGQTSSKRQKSSTQNSGTASTSSTTTDSLPGSRKRRMPDDQTVVPQKRGMPISIQDSLNDKITEDIWQYFVKHKQSDDRYMAKVNLRDALYVIFKDVFQYCGLYMVGSSMSGFATRTSDLDLCLMLCEDEINGKKEAVEILLAIQNCLRRCNFIFKSQLIRARVPILKFEDYDYHVECDLNINNAVGIRNTHLLRYYAAMDWRVRPLVLFMKKWARFHDINDASKKTISSYSLCLMMIHYLQYGCNPPVLDSIQKLYPDLFDYGDDIRNLKMNVKIEFKSKNSQSLGDLFLGFLEYYSQEFDYDNDVASVRLGCKVPISMVMSWTPRNEASMWKCLNIEEPFDKSNTARSCFDEQTFSRVKRVIFRSYKTLKQTRSMSRIFQSPF
ncbi:zinc finger protein [Mactra antiquata]